MRVTHTQLANALDCAGIGLRNAQNVRATGTFLKRKRILWAKPVEPGRQRRASDPKVRARERNVLLVIQKVLEPTESTDRCGTKIVPPRVLEEAVHVPELHIPSEQIVFW
jgi:hypothetical protein